MESSRSYQLLRQSEDCVAPNSLLTRSSEKLELGLNRQDLRVPWIIATSIFALLSLLLGLPYLRTPSTCGAAAELPVYGTFENGFKTEIGNALSHIKLEAIRFSGGLKYDNDGRLYRNIDSSQVDYVGKPTPEMDKAWHSLIDGRYPRFKYDNYEGPGREEAFNKNGIVQMGVDVLHSLHCLNKIRKSLDRNYYAEDLAREPPEVRRIHVDHCIDYLRQMLQCKGDLTPLPVYWAAGANRTVPDFDVIHTCRNFESLREWTTAQNLRVIGTVLGAHEVE